MPVSEATITKLENLLKLATHERTGEKEAQAAMLAAQRLAARYHLELSDFELREETKEEVLTAEVRISKNNSPWRYMVVQIIARNFRCIEYRNIGYFGRTQERRVSLVLMGLKSDVTIAKKVAMYALDYGERGVLEYAKGGIFNVSGTHKEAREIRDSWLAGYTEGLAEVFKRQVAENSETAIMVVTPPEVSEAYKGLNAKSFAIGQPLATQREAFSNGYTKGKEFTGPQEQLT